MDARVVLHWAFWLSLITFFGSLVVLVIVIIRHDTYEVLDEYFFPGAEIYDEQRAEESIANFNDNNDGIVAIYHAFEEMSKMKDLANLYTLLDSDHTYFVGSKTGLITAYGDADPSDSRSAIVKKREFQLPAEATGPVMGINITYDGHAHGR